jgi:hypothetical protein
MFRQNRSRIVAFLSMATGLVLFTPAVEAQSEAVRKQLLSAVQ